MKSVALPFDMVIHQKLTTIRAMPSLVFNSKQMWDYPKGIIITVTPEKFEEEG